MTRKTVVVMVGIPGSGKSTISKQQYPNAVVCSADHYFMKSGEYLWNKQELGRAHSECQGKFIMAVRRGELLIVVDNTNINLHDRNFYITFAAKYGYDVKIHYVHVRPLDAFQRNIHNVPLETIERMHQKLMRELNVTAYSYDDSTAGKGSE